MIGNSACSCVDSIFFCKLKRFWNTTRTKGNWMEGTRQSEIQSITPLKWLASGTEILIAYIDANRWCVIFIKYYTFRLCVTLDHFSIPLFLSQHSTTMETDRERPNTRAKINKRLIFVERKFVLLLLCFWLYAPRHSHTFNYMWWMMISSILLSLWVLIIHIFFNFAFVAVAS